MKNTLLILLILCFSPGVCQVQTLVSKGEIPGMHVGLTAYVEVTGNDATASIGDPTYPFATLSAAMDAVTSAGRFIVGVGTFPSPASSKFQTGDVIIGSGRPLANTVISTTATTTETNTSPTALIGGTIFQGTFSIPYNIDHITLRDFGVDVGLTYVNANFSGTAQEGLIIASDYSSVGGGAYASADGFHRLQTSVNPRQAMTVDNVSVLCKNPTSLVHAFLIENSYNPSVSKIYTYYGFAGIVIKCIGGMFSDLHANGHGTYGIIAKANDFAFCYGIKIEGFEIRSIGAYDGAGFYLNADDGGAPVLGYMNISNGTIIGTKTGIISENTTTGNIDGLQLQNINILLTQGAGINIKCIFSNLQNIIARACGTTGITVVGVTSFPNSLVGCSSDGNTGYGFNLTNCLYNGLRTTNNTSGNSIQGTGNTTF